MLNTWVLMADSGKALIEQYQGPNSPLSLIEKKQHDLPPSREISATKRGRMYDAGPNQKSAMEHPTDPKEHEKHMFVKEVADYLDSHHREFDRLVIAAAPQTLGELRANLSKQVLKKTDGQIDKDLTNMPEPDQRKHLQDILYINAEAV